MINDFFYYRVMDDSMMGDGIRLGDTVLIEIQKIVFPKDITAVVSGSKIILRHIEQIGLSYLMTSSNPKHLPEMIENIAIIGRVVKQVISI